MAKQLMNLHTGNNHLENSLAFSSFHDKCPKVQCRAVETIFLIFNSQLNSEGPSRSNSREHSPPPSYESDLLSLGTEATAPQPLIDDSIEPIMRGEISSNEITPTLY